MPILFPELKGKSQSGLYAISPDKPAKKKKLNFKLGRTVQFTKRLNSYHICWNKVFYIYVMLPLRPGLFPNQKKELLQFTKALEKVFFQKVAKGDDDIKEEHLDTRRYKSEWYITTQETLDKVFKDFYVECQEGKHDFVDKKTKQAFSFKDMLEEPMTEWDDPFLSKDDEDEDLKRLRGQTVHVGELKKDADNKMVIPTNIPKGLPKTREAEGSKRKIVSTLHSKYKDFHTQVKQ